MIIYMHTSRTSKKSYIGKTSKTMEERLNEHNMKAQRQKGLFHFQRAILKYGIDDFESVILESDLDNSQSIIREKYWIKYYNTFLGQGYNSTDGGDGFPSGEDHPMYGSARFGEKNPFYGKSHSDETKKVLSEKRLDKVSCKDKDGNKFTITKEEFDRRDDLVGITKGNTDVDSEETRFAKGSHRRGKTLEKFPCNHCGKEMDKSNLTRYHNDNCKFK